MRFIFWILTSDIIDLLLSSCSVQFYTPFFLAACFYVIILWWWQWSYRNEFKQLWILHIKFRQAIGLQFFANSVSVFLGIKDVLANVNHVSYFYMYVGIALSVFRDRRKVFCTGNYRWSYFPVTFVAEFYLLSDWLAADYYHSFLVLHGCSS